MSYPKFERNIYVQEQLTFTREIFLESQFIFLRYVLFIIRHFCISIFV